MRRPAWARWCIGFSRRPVSRSRLRRRTCIYTTVLTDTGGFIYGGTRASTFALARDLTLAGADPIRIAQQVYFSTPMSKLLLLGAALRNLHREGRLAWLWITHEDMVRSCAARGGLRGHRELCPLDRRRGSGGVFCAKLAGAACTREPAQQGRRQCGSDCGAAWRRRPRECRGLHAGRVRWCVREEQIVEELRALRWRQRSQETDESVSLASI